MKKLIFILIIGLAQVVSSGKASVLINNKQKQEVIQDVPVVQEQSTTALPVRTGELQ